MGTNPTRGVEEAPRHAAPAGPSSEQPSPLQDLLSELTRQPFGTGAALAIFVDGDASVFASGVRWADGPDVTERTQFNVASVSKLVTAAKVIELSHRERLALGDTVKDRLPGVILLDGSGVDRAAEVTIEQLLTHTGGLPHQPASLDPASIGSSWADPDLLSRLTASWSITLANDPGEYSYSNLGYALLGAIVERVEGEPFADVMHGFLRELGMTHATFWAEDVSADVARGRVVQDGEVVFLEPQWYGSRYALPFTGLFVSMPDLMRFGQELIEAHRDPSAPLHAMTRLDGEAGHGRGPVFRQRSGLQSLEHDGGGPGFMAWLLVVPERGLVMAVACNGDGEERETARRLFEWTEEALSAVTEPAPD